MTERTVLVGNGQGFWGDSPLGPVRLVREGPLHYLTLDYLAEVTMSILQKARAKNPKAGFATDFPRMLKEILVECRQKGIRVLANAGGVNPHACAEAVALVARELGLHGLRIGVVEGDDLMGHLPDLLAAGEPLTNLDTGQPLQARLTDVQCANVYLGAAPLVEALQLGAEVVICGRCTDPSLVVAPLVYEFGWKFDDYDRLAAATVAGHILECGTQATGGNFYRWKSMPNLARVGYPIAEAHDDGSVVITKHEGTGGLVDLETVTAQLVYEIGDPRRYLTPDVIADFTSITLHQQARDRVQVSGVRGGPPTASYKVSIGVHEGFKVVGQLTVVGPDAIERAQLCASMLFERLESVGINFPPERRIVELVGTNVCLPGMTAAVTPMELVLHVGAKDRDPAKLDRFGMELAPLLTSGPPGLTGFAGGRPKPSPMVGFWPALLPKSKASAKVSVQEVP